MSDFYLKNYVIGNYNISVSSSYDERYIEIVVSINPMGSIHFGIDKGIIYFLNMYTPTQLVEMLTNKEVMQKISQIREIAQYFKLLIDTVNNLKV